MNSYSILLVTSHRQTAPSVFHLMRRPLAGMAGEERRLIIRIKFSNSQLSPPKDLQDKREASLDCSHFMPQHEQPGSDNFTEK